MYEVVLSNRFRRDLKLAARRGCDLALLNDIVERLAKGEALAARHRDHNLTGDYSGGMPYPAGLAADLPDGR